jgi:UDP-N-acetylmuramoyl-L-alanyl-D-glutamate--2,6-diaminopimelate ligase
MGRIAAAAADLLIATSDNPRSEDPPAIVAQMLTGVAARARRAARPRGRRPGRRDRSTPCRPQPTPDDLVLIAGKGHEDYQILGTSGKIHFDDREHAARALTRRQRS